MHQRDTPGLLCKPCKSSFCWLHPGWSAFWSFRRFGTRSCGVGRHQVCRRYRSAETLFQHANGCSPRLWMYNVIDTFQDRIGDWPITDLIKYAKSTCQSGPIDGIQELDWDTPTLMSLLQQRGYTGATPRVFWTHLNVAIFQVSPRICGESAEVSVAKMTFDFWDIKGRLHSDFVIWHL